MSWEIAVLKPVKKQSLPDAIFDQLRGQIVHGHMEAGTVLPAERELSEVLGVNRQAVREALKRLEQARLVSIQQGGQTRVLNYLDTAGTDLLAQLLLTSDGKLRAQVIRSVLEMRSALAPDIARLCAERASPEQKDVLDRLVRDMKDAGDDLLRLQELSMAFWATLVEGSGNVAYRLAFNSLRDTYAPVRAALANVLEAELTSHALYVAVAQAVRAGDAAVAQQTARNLIQQSVGRLMEMVDALALMNQENP